jgi:hypothetical protein
VEILPVPLDGSATIVSKDAIIEGAWLGITVEPDNLTVHIASCFASWTMPKRRQLHPDGTWLELPACPSCGLRRAAVGDQASLSLDAGPGAPAVPKFIVHRGKTRGTCPCLPLRPRSLALTSQTSSTFQEAFHSLPPRILGGLPGFITTKKRPTHTRVYWYRGGCGAREVAGVPERRNSSSLHSVSCARAGS